MRERKVEKLIVEKRGRKREEEKKEKRKKRKKKWVCAQSEREGRPLYIDYITFVAPIYRLYIVYITFITFSVFPQPFCAPSIVQSHLHFFHNYSIHSGGYAPPLLSCLPRFALHAVSQGTPLTNTLLGLTPQRGRAARATPPPAAALRATALLAGTKG